MNLIKNNKKIKSNGIIRFWNLPNKIHIILDSNFKDKLMKEFMKIVRTKYNANKLTGIARITISDYINKKDSKIRIDFLLKIINIINKKEFDLNNVEKNIKWIGHFNSQGIVNPKLPFNFNFRQGARFLAAICNDGWISDGVYYSNNEKGLRDSVKKDALSVFGGNKNTIRDWIKAKDQYLSFPSVIKDALILMTEFKGIKSENNPPIPSFILKNKELMYGWIEQTIADEGHVKHYPETYRREIVWRRSFNKNLDNYKLNRDEIKMLDKIGIKYTLYNVGFYKTKKGIEKTRLQIIIAKRKNLLKLRKFITVPCKRKEKTFTKMMKGFVRYKEPLRIKDAIIDICKNKKYLTAKDLAKSMNYKNISHSYKWIKHYMKEGLLTCIQKFYYKKDNNGPIPAKYVLNHK